MKNIKKISKNLFVVASLMACLLCMAGVNTQAASKDWSLRYIKGAPGSDQISSWSKSVTTTCGTTTMKVSKVGGGATIMVYTSNGIAALYSGSGSSSVQTTKGTAIYASANFQSTGSSNSYPSGSLTY